MSVLFTVLNNNYSQVKLVETDLSLNMTFGTSADGLDCTRTRKMKQFVICPYNVTEDVFISKSIIDTGQWEPELSLLVTQLCTMYQNATFIDVGANIGYFTLLAASIGNDVIAIEPVEQNVHKLSQAVRLNKLRKKIRILKYAVSNTRRTVILRTPALNKGSTRVTMSEEILLGERNDVQTAASITIDDVVTFIKSNDVILKLDIEGHECLALERSGWIFSKFRTHAVIVEWRKMLTQRHKYGVACPGVKISNMARYLMAQGLVPFDVNTRIRLDYRTAETWGYNNVAWLPSHQVTE